MTAATYPARHEAIRKVLIERGYVCEHVDGIREKWVNERVVDDFGIPVLIVLPLQQRRDYEPLCEHIEIKLGLRLPPEAQRAVDAERARCMAIAMKIANEAALALTVFADGKRTVVWSEVQRAAERIARSIESGEVPA